MPWAKSFCPFRACCLRAASSLSFGRGDKAAESGDVDYEYHHIIKGLYATFSSWHIDPCCLFIPIQHWQERQGCGICFLQHQN